jgi:hypothetical protein
LHTSRCLRECRPINQTQNPESGGRSSHAPRHTQR